MSECVPDIFKIRAGDTLPALRALLSDRLDNIPDFTGATGKMVMFDSEGNILINAAVTLHPSPVVDALTGEDYNVQYDWAAGDTDQDPGSYAIEFPIVMAGGGTVTFPSEDEDNPVVKIGKAAT